MVTGRWKVEGEGVFPELSVGLRHDGRVDQKQYSGRGAKGGRLGRGPTLVPNWLRS